MNALFPHQATTGDVTVRTFSTSAGPKSATAHPSGGSVSLALTGLPTAVEAP